MKRALDTDVIGSGFVEPASITGLLLVGGGEHEASYRG
jgi:hypothetical protein